MKFNYKLVMRSQIPGINFYAPIQFEDTYLGTDATDPLPCIQEQMGLLSALP